MKKTIAFMLIASSLHAGSALGLDILTTDQNTPPLTPMASGRDVGACMPVASSGTTMVPVRTRIGSVCTNLTYGVWSSTCQGGWIKQPVTDLVSVSNEDLSKLVEQGYGQMTTVMMEHFGGEYPLTTYTPIKSVDEHGRYLSQALGLTSIESLFAEYRYGGYSFVMGSVGGIFDMLTNPPSPDDRAMTHWTACPIGTYIGHTSGTGSSSTYSCCSPSQ